MNPIDGEKEGGALQAIKDCSRRSHHVNLVTEVDSFIDSLKESSRIRVLRLEILTVADALLRESWFNAQHRPTI